MSDVVLVGAAPQHTEDPAALGTIFQLRASIVAGSNVVVGVCGLNFAVTGVSDGTTNITVPDVAIVQGSTNQRIALFSFPAHGGGTKTFTATYAGSAAFRGIFVAELSPSTLDGIASVNNGFSSGTLSTGNVAPAPAVGGEYAIGYCVADFPLTQDAAFTEFLNDTAVNDAEAEGLAQAVAAAIAATWTMGSLGSWGAVAATYKPSAAAASTTPVSDELSQFPLMVQGARSTVMVFS